jgi:glycosyltransferase involved in cell wall biosynthesis
MSACGYYRSVLPTAHLHGELLEEGVELTASNKYDDENDYDAYVFGRVPDQFTFMAAIRAFKKDKKIIWDLDDDFTSIPDWFPTKENYGNTSINYVAESLAMATHVTLSTAHLERATLGAWPALGGKTTVLENLVDIQTYLTDYRKREGKPQFTRILWTGSHTHVGDLAPLHAVAEFASTTPGYHLVIFGWLPDELNDKNCVTHIPWISKRHYEGVMSFINPDISLLPLIDCPFNRCKSAIKYYESTMAGATCIASDIPPFYDVITDKVTGLLLPNGDPQRWIDAITAYRYYEDFCMGDMKDHARREVIEEFSWNTDNKRRRAWREFFLNVAG